MEIKKRKRGERNGVKYNQKKRGQELEMFLFIIVADCICSCSLG